MHILTGSTSQDEHPELPMQAFIETTDVLPRMRRIDSRCK